MRLKASNKCMTVQILLSTYNGATYLKPLMDSLLQQDYPQVSILVRDDGSSDNTVHLLQEYATNENNIQVVFGKNIGFVQSFLHLIELASSNADYLALCDQDDVWRSNKISQAIEYLQQYPQEIPVLYGSRAVLVDENLKMLGYTDIPQKKLSFQNALVECTLLGCTSLFNQATRQLLLGKFPRYAYGHDWWIYLVVSAFGIVLYDCEPKIIYRQHDKNVFGISSTILDKTKMKIYRFLTQGKQQLVVKQAEEFRRIYESLLSDKYRKTLEDFLESRKWLGRRLIYALFSDVYRQSPIDNLILKILLVLNRL